MSPDGKYPSRVKTKSGCIPVTLESTHRQIPLVLCGDHHLRYTKVIRHTDKGLSASVAQWVKAAYYLGILFKKSTPEQISHFLEVDLT